MMRAHVTFEQNADVKSARAACDALPASLKGDLRLTRERVYYAMLVRVFCCRERNYRSNSQTRDFRFRSSSSASKSSNCSLSLFREIVLVWRSLAPHVSSSTEKSRRTRLIHFLLVVLALTDLALGVKNIDLQARRALEMRPISGDAYEGPFVARNCSMVMHG